MLRTQYDTAQFNLTQVRADLGAAKAGEAAAKASEASARALEYDSRIKAANAQVKATEAQASADAAQARADLIKAQAIDAGKQILETEKQAAQLKNQNERLLQTYNQLQVKNDALEKQNNALEARADTVLLGNVRVPVGRTIIARSLAPGTSFLEARAQLSQMLARGALLVSGDATNPDIGPGLLPGAPLQLAPLGNGEGGVLTDPSAILDALADYVSGRNDAVSVRLVAARNHLANETKLNARFLVVPIRPALAAGTELANATVDGQKSDVLLFSALLKLVDDARQSAEQNGVTPPLSPEAPNFYAPGSREQIFRTIRALSDVNGPARVSIVTNQAISNVDPLRVQFDIEPLAPGTLAQLQPAT